MKAVASSTIADLKQVKVEVEVEVGTARLKRATCNARLQGGRSKLPIRGRQENRYSAVSIVDRATCMGAFV